MSSERNKRDRVVFKVKHVSSVAVSFREFGVGGHQIRRNFTKNTQKYSGISLCIRKIRLNSKNSCIRRFFISIIREICGQKVEKRLFHPLG